MFIKFYLSLLFIVLVICTSCNKILGEDEELTLTRTEYSGNALRMDGYYYVEEEENFQGVFYSRYFLYTNGILRGGGATESLSVENNWFSGDLKNDWGVFQISGSNIKYEKWYGDSGGNYVVYQKIGEVLNDTIFRITRSVRIDGSEDTNTDEYYHFKVYTPKLDSTNMYIP